MINYGIFERKLALLVALQGENIWKGLEGAGGFRNSLLEEARKVRNTTRHQQLDAFARPSHDLHTT